MDCIFCKIAAGEIPATIVSKDDDVIAVTDVNPQAPTHVLVMPVEHHSDIGELADAKDASLTAKLFEVASRIGRENGPNGYRLVMNTGPEAGQSVDHLHVHVLAGRVMSWPPG